MDAQYDKLKELQIENSKLVSSVNRYTIKEIKYVGGLDISFHPKDENIACVGLSIFTFPELKQVYLDTQVITLTMPYVSGLLGFREVEHYATLLKKLHTDRPELYPQVVLVDGNGILHVRKYGSACQIGVEMDIPTIGVGKSLYCQDGLSPADYNSGKIKLISPGEYLPLMGKSGYCWGGALRSSKSINPIFVSIGHLIDLPTAIQIVYQCCQYRIPEPIRCSDIETKIPLSQV